MSLERVLKTLASFNLSPIESEIYIYLSKMGPKTAKDIGSGLGLAKQQVYPALRGLKKKGIVISRPKPTTLFSVLTFNELLNYYIKRNAEEAKAITDVRVDIEKNWQEIIEQKEEGD
jgi:sugar-specific transcriptional regulator TrmB